MTTNTVRYRRSRVADRRIRFSQSKRDILESLVSAGDREGPFKLYADALAFAAALAASQGVSEPFDDPTKEPIRLGVFENAGTGVLFALLAVAKTKDPMILAKTDEMEDRRATIFEEYANGGLSLLAGDLKGAPDVQKELILLVKKYAASRDKEDVDLDLRQLLS